MLDLRSGTGFLKATMPTSTAILAYYIVTHSGVTTKMTLRMTSELDGLTWAASVLEVCLFSVSPPPAPPFSLGSGPPGWRSTALTCAAWSQ